MNNFSRLPIVLARSEITRIISNLNYTNRLKYNGSPQPPIVLRIFIDDGILP